MDSKHELANPPRGTFPPLVASSTGTLQVFTGFADEESSEETELDANSFTVILHEDRPRAALGVVSAVHGKQVITVFGMANVAVIESEDNRKGKVIGDDEIRAKFLGSPAHEALYSTIRTAIMTIAGLIDVEVSLPQEAPTEDCEIEILHGDEEPDDDSDGSE